MVNLDKYPDYIVKSITDNKYILQHIVDTTKQIHIYYEFHKGKKYLESEHWQKNNKYFRDNGPAFIVYYPSGKIKGEYYSLGKPNYLDRTDGPAFITYYPNGNKSIEIWKRHNMKHREDFPAYIKYNKVGDILDQKYYYNNILIKYSTGLLNILKNMLLSNPNLDPLEYNKILKKESTNMFD